VTTERALDGGRQTVGVIRVGDTLRRPLHARSEFVHALLRHLACVGFDGAPRVLETDERGREVLTSGTRKPLRASASAGTRTSWSERVP